MDSRSASRVKSVRMARPGLHTSGRPPARTHEAAAQAHEDGRRLVAVDAPAVLAALRRRGEQARPQRLAERQRHRAVRKAVDARPRNGRVPACAARGRTALAARWAPRARARGRAAQGGRERLRRRLGRRSG